MLVRVRGCAHAPRDGPHTATAVARLCFGRGPPGGQRATTPLAGETDVCVTWVRGRREPRGVGRGFTVDASTTLSRGTVTVSRGAQKTGLHILTGWKSPVSRDSEEPDAVIPLGGETSPSPGHLTERDRHA